MALLQIIAVKESKEVLYNHLRRCCASAKPRLKMLLLLVKGVVKTKELAVKVGVSGNCISTWKQLYEKQGLAALLLENRGGHKRGAINKEAHAQLQERLSNPKGGFTSYKQAMEWINERFGLQMNYQAVNKYLKYHFDTKLKTGRKTHVQKDPLAEETFKKGTCSQPSLYQSNQTCSAV